MKLYYLSFYFILLVSLNFSLPRAVSFIVIFVNRNYLHYVQKYNRFEKRHKNVSCHLSPAFRDVSPGDVAIVGECRYE